MKLPLEELKEKYIPIDTFPEKYNISVARVQKLIKKYNLRVAEFRVPGESRRCYHANYEEVLAAHEKEVSLDESNTQCGSVTEF